VNKPKISQKRGPGRPKSEASLSFGSLAAAASHIGDGCSVDLLKAAKKAGCPAFRQSRIYVAELTEWLKENPIDPSKIQTKEKLQIRKLTAECLAKERENAVEDGKLVAIEEVAAINAKVDADVVRSIIESFGNDAMIQGLVGLSFAGIKAALTVAVDSCLAEIHLPSNANAPA